IGGDDDPIGPPTAQVWEYDPVANIFVATRSPIPHARGGAGFGIIKGHFYVAGGNNSANLLEDYEIAANTWTLRANLPTPISDPGSGVVNGQLWLFGGQTDSAAVATSMFYDPPSDIWSTGPEMNIARSFPAGTGIGNALICMGGANGPN